MKLWNCHWKMGQTHLKRRRISTVAAAGRLNCDTHNRQRALDFQIQCCECCNCVDSFWIPSACWVSTAENKNNLSYFAYTVSSNTGICHGHTIRTANIFPHFLCSLHFVTVSCCLFCSGEANLVYLFPLHLRNAIICNSNEIFQSFHLPIGSV